MHLDTLTNLAEFLAIVLPAIWYLGRKGRTLAHRIEARIVAKVAAVATQVQPQSEDEPTIRQINQEQTDILHKLEQKIGERLTVVEKRVDGHDARIDDHETRIGNIEGRLDRAGIAK